MVAHVLHSRHVSTREPARGSTSEKSIVAVLPMFQPASPRGARRRSLTSKDTCDSFNPRAREGLDPTTQRGTARVLTFQPASPRGARPSLLDLLALVALVSTREPARGSTNLLEHASIRIGFQPASPRGARRRARSRPRPATSFNPRAREGLDFVARRASARGVCFNPRAREGLDGQFDTFDDVPGNVSTREPARGSTDIEAEYRMRLEFQPASPRGARP